MGWTLLGLNGLVALLWIVAPRVDRLRERRTEARGERDLDALIAAVERADRIGDPLPAAATACRRAS